MEKEGSDLKNQYMFVYGTLKKGFGNHEWMRGFPFVGNATVGGVSIVASVGLPYAVTDSDGVAHGELYGPVAIKDVETVDLLEGHPDFYCRREVDVSYIDEGRQEKTVKAWCYFCESKNYLPKVNGQWRR
jgi:gamma-glutamylcyclotransferase (GGCT)/AIG2-like uncharacterized protein YtfP